MNTKTKRYIVFVAVIAIAIVGIVFFTRGKKSNASSNTLAATSVGTAEKSTIVNSELEFPIKNDKGEEVSKFKYTVESAEIRDEIIVKGQRVTPQTGKTFLVLNLKLSNSLNQTIKINTRDYIRLIRNGNPAEQLAADVHNDPVEVQAISTKTSRVAFPINKTDSDLQLQIGEIAGEKQIVPVTFN